MRKIRLGIVFGGRSGEHEVSLQSARSVMDAVDTDKYDVVPIGITKDGRWLASGDPMRALTSGDPDASQPAALLMSPESTKVTESTLSSVQNVQKGLMCLDESGEVIRATPLAELDVVFPVLHGPYGEDGTVQGLLELAGLPYVGAPVTASAVAMDKVIFKDVIRAHGLPTVEHVVVKRKRWESEPDNVLARIADRFGYPLFTKPANLGSSVGITKCHDRAQLIAGLREAARYDRKLLVEPAVPAAREIEVSVLGNDAPVASLPGEIVPSREFYNYEAKYIDDGEEASDLLIPAPLSMEMTRRVQNLAVETYRAIDCAGLARVDFLLSGETADLYVNEVNTIPGFTKISMYPKLWEASGLPYSELIDRLIELALERHRDKARTEISYQPRE
jgi:D-alanine-D-alanine ligase